MTKNTLSLCPFCGVGCRLKYETENGALKSVSGDPTDPVSEGKPCSKPLLLPIKLREAGPRRITQPMILGQPATWPEAYKFIYENTKNLAPQEILLVGSGKITNESNFAIREFGLNVLKTTNIDSCCTRLCHGATVQAMRDCFGVPNLTNLSNLTKCDTLLIIGSNPLGNYPVFWQKVLIEKKRGLKVLSIQSMFNLTNKTLDHKTDFTATINQGSEQVILNGLINYLIVHKKFSPKKNQIDNFTLLKKITTRFTPEFVTRQCHLDKTQFQRLATALAETKNLGIFHGMGLTQHVNGTANLRTLLNLSILKSAFIFSLRGEVNVQGAGDIINQPTEIKGANLIEALMINPVKAAFLSGFNPAQSLPDSQRVWQNLRKMFLVVLDTHWNKTCELAKVVLPTRLLFEQNGHVTTGERRLRPTQDIGLNSPGKPDYMIYSELSKVFGYNDYSHYKNYKIYKTPRFVRFFPEDWAGFDDPRSSQYPFLLTSFRQPNAFLTGEILPGQDNFFWINPRSLSSITSLKSLITTESPIAIVETSIGRLAGQIKFSDDLPKDLIAASFHNPNFPLNLLFPLEFDPLTFTPNFKATACRIVVK